MKLLMKTLLLLAVALAPMGLWAQDFPSNKPAFPLWTAPIPDSQGAYAVSLNSICSVALEKYDLKYEDKVFPVTECSVATVGGKTARFYFVDEDKKEKKKEDEDGPLGQVKAAVATVVPGMEEDEDSEENQKKLRVVKIYPESASTGTVEYRLATKARVIALYRDLRDTWVASAP